MRKLLWSGTLALVCFSAAAEWHYRTDLDKMTSKEVRVATIQSSNSLELSSPYAGRNHGYLSVRQHPKYGLDVIVGIQKGQLLCRSYDGCAVLVRFDAAPPIKFSASSAADHDPTLIFLNDSRRFIAQAQKAKRILVQAAIYQNGDQILEFNAGTPLKWASPAAPQKQGQRGGSTGPSAAKADGGCPASTGFSSEGDCGVRYAACHVEVGSMHEPARGRWMRICMKDGIEAANADWKSR